jgi:hypothetical protein
MTRIVLFSCLGGTLAAFCWGDERKHGGSTFGASDFLFASPASLARFLPDCHLSAG